MRTPENAGSALGVRLHNQQAITASSYSPMLLTEGVDGH
jgi:hypothetical protein